MTGRTKWAKRKRRSSTNWQSKATRFAIYHRDGFDCVPIAAGSLK